MKAVRDDKRTSRFLCLPPFPLFRYLRYNFAGSRSPRGKTHATFERDGGRSLRSVLRSAEHGNAAEKRQ